MLKYNPLGLGLRVDIDAVYNTLVPAIGIASSGRAFTAVLFVSPDGNGLDGSTWLRAYTTIQDALDACSTDVNDCTLIYVGPTSTWYDIGTTGDPTWSCNVEIRGTHRIWAPIKNVAAGATSILNFSGKAAIQDLAIFQIGTINGVCFTGNGWRVRKCGFNSEGLTAAATSLDFDGSVAQISGGIMNNVQFQANKLYTKCLHLENSKVNEIGYLNIHKAKTGIHIEGTSDDNIIWETDIGGCALGVDIDSGDGQHFNDINFHSNDRNIDDEVGNHTYNNIKGATPIEIYPDNFTGVNVPSAAGADTWGALTTVVAADAIDNPFRLVTGIFNPTVSQWTRIKITSDAGSSYTNEYMFDANRRAGNAAASGTDFIYNAGTKVEATTKVVGAGPDNLAVWFKVQEI